METAYEYETFITGTDLVATTSAIVASGEVLAKRTPLGMETVSGKLKAFDPTANDGTETAVYLSALPVDASAGDVQVPVYKSGTFDPDLVIWPDGVTDIQKAVAFVGTPISLQSPAQR